MILVGKFQDIFVSGTHGYHTFRIPALIRTTVGTVLAFAEGRRNSRSDTGDIDMVLRRSTDGGQTFGSLRVVVPGDGDVAGNPAPVVDRDTGRITLLFCRNPHDGPEDLVWQGKADRTVWLTCSDDDGTSWAEPREISSDVKRAGWTWYATGPCHGIQLRSGRLVVPCDHGVGRQFERYIDWCRSHLLLSDDGGTTWRIGAETGDGTNECVAVEFEDRSIYVNRRCDRRDEAPANKRRFARSSDEGESFHEDGWMTEVTDPHCQGSALSAVLEEQHHGWGPETIVFANASSTERERLTVRRSDDGGRNWSNGQLVHVGPAAYSDLCSLDHGTVGLLFECGAAMPYERIRWMQIDINSLGATSA